MEQSGRGRVRKPAVIGALIQLGNCFDLMDTRFTSDLADGYAIWSSRLMTRGVELPKNAGGTPELKLRRLDCAVLNWYLDMTATMDPPQSYDTVRCGFLEGCPVYEGGRDPEEEPHPGRRPQPGLHRGCLQTDDESSMSAKSKKPLEFQVAPHANAKVHAQLMKKLKAMTPEEVFQTAVKSGIYTSKGKLKKQYAAAH